YRSGNRRAYLTWRSSVRQVRPEAKYASRGRRGSLSSAKANQWALESVVQLPAQQVPHESFDSPDRSLPTPMRERSRRLPVPVRYDSAVSSLKTIRYTDEGQGSDGGRTRSSSHLRSVGFPCHRASARRDPRPQTDDSETE